MRRSSEERSLPRWYVAYTQPHREGRAATHLRYQGFHTFLPLYRKTVRHARRFRTAKAPFFPRYLFVQITLGRDRWRSIAGTFGISHLVMEGDRPKPISSTVIDDLMSRADPAGVISLHGVLQPGEAVRFAKGPFTDLVGELAKLDDDGRVAVLLDCLGAGTRVSADRIDLVPAR